jgi:hypothetical protein
VRRHLVSQICLAVLCLNVVPARANPSVVGSFSETQMAILQKNGDATVVVGEITAEGPDSVLQVKIQDTVTGDDLDAVTLTPYSLEALLTFTGSGNDYSAVGTLRVWDRLGDTSTTPEIYGQFVSTQIVYSHVLPAVGCLSVAGSLSEVSGQGSILLPSSDPWVFSGDGPDDDITADADGVPGTVRLLTGVSSYDAGGMIALHFPIFGDLGTLQDVFGYFDAINNGDVQARIESVCAPDGGLPVPVPGGAALVLVGVAIVRLGRRRST